MKSRNYRHTKHTDEFIRAENVATGEVRYFKNGIEAAKALGCSHVLVYNVISGKCANTAKGWTLAWIPRDAEEAQEFAMELSKKEMQKELLRTQVKVEAKIAKAELRKKMKKLAKELKEKQRELERLEMRKLVEGLKEERKKRVWESHAVLQLTMDGKLVREYKTVSEAIRETGLFTIRNCVKGTQGHAGGFIWKYKVEE